MKREELDRLFNVEFPVPRVIAPMVEDIRQASAAVAVSLWSNMPNDRNMDDAIQRVWEAMRLAVGALINAYRKHWREFERYSVPPIMANDPSVFGPDELARARERLGRVTGNHEPEETYGPVS